MKPTAYSLQSAFTLIEVLVAMAVLSILILLAANIFQGSSSAFNIGSQKADMNTAARAALDFMARELESAVAGRIEKSESGGEDELTFYQAADDDLRFLSVTESPDSSSRALRECYFWFEDQKLRYGRDVEPECYSSATWYNDKPAGALANDLIANVMSLQFQVYTTLNALLNGTPEQIPPAKIFYQLPVCVDIALEMLSDDDMRRYNQLSGADQTAFSNRNAKVYTTRVYFPNRMGYQ